MSKIVTYGIGGHCENCDETHDHPLHNIISEIEIPDNAESDTDETPSPA